MTAARGSVERWAASFAWPPTRTFAADAAAIAAWHERASGFAGSLAASDESAELARSRWREAVRAVHTPFLRRHHAEVVGLTAARELRALVRRLGEVLPGVLPTADELAADRARPLSVKVGFEYKSAVAIAELLSSPLVGREILDASRAPSAAARGLLGEFLRDDRIELAGARIERRGPVAAVEITSPDALNAESEATLDDLETCADLVALDDRIAVATLRGGPVNNAKYAGRRVFCSGLDLSGLHGGRLSYLYYVRRELGLVSKLYRGVWDAASDRDLEKPWIAIVDRHAIGGGCQLLLVMDHVIAERDAVLMLPARREGIIPGAANLRLARIVGERAARRALLLDAPIRVESDAGRLLVDQAVAPDQLEAAVEASVRDIVGSGLISLAANRKALRIAQEPVDTFREYMAHFALAQADCHFSGELIRNLDRHWVNRARR